jgi:hypothetical protein
MCAVHFQHGTGRCFYLMDRRSLRASGIIHDADRPVRWWVTLPLTCVVGCAAPIEAPSAYTSERFLCGDEQAAEFDSQVEWCREASLRDGSCSGIVSLKGSVDSHPIVIDSTAGKVTYVEKSGRTDGRGGELSELKVYARSPYFAFGLTLLSQPLDLETPEVPGVCRDPTGFFSLEARGGSDFVPMYFLSCDLRLRTPQAMWVAFSANLRVRGNLDGCFYIFPELL